MIINVCKEKLHYFEFVKPVEEIVKGVNTNYSIAHYLELSKRKIDKASKIIICGTSLMDSEYFDHIAKFEWIKYIKVPVLGICAGMQIICRLFGYKLVKKTEIGLLKVYFKKTFLGVKGWQEVYSLHTFAVKNLPDFDVISKTSIPQAAKHKKNEIYLTLFHPEVRQKQIIYNFINQ